MSDKIKKFFLRKKEEVNFKLGIGSGSGRKLNSPSESSKDNKTNKTSSSHEPQRKRNELSEEARMAANAAITRIQQKNSPKEFNTSLAAIKARVKRELEAEQKLKENQLKSLKDNENQSGSGGGGSSSGNETECQSGVYFRCPLISLELLPEKEWSVKIKEFLYQQLNDDNEESAVISSLIIKNCNKREKSEGCIEIMCKYIENIINNPDEEKYRKIRMNNRIFCDKVRYIDGALEFLKSIGFQQTKIDDDDYLLWTEDNIDNLKSSLEILHDANEIQLELDRNIQILLPSQARKKIELPYDFYYLTPEEIKREQQLQREILENSQILKTKAMREKEELRNLNKYRFALIRIKLPNGIYLQGTFNVHEKLINVYEFVQSCLQDETIEFTLITPVGDVKLTDNDLNKSLKELKLIPNAVLIFIQNNTAAGSSSSSTKDTNLLKEELLMLIQNM